MQGPYQAHQIIRQYGNVENFLKAQYRDKMNAESSCFKAVRDVYYDALKAKDIPVNAKLLLCQ